MTNIKKIMAAIMAAALTVSMTACGKSGLKNDPTQSTESEIQYISTYERVTPTLPKGYVNSDVVADGKIFFSAEEIDEYEKYLANRIGIVDLESKDVVLTDIQADLLNDNRLVQQINVDKNGDYVLVLLDYKNDIPSTYLAKVSKDGNVLSQGPMSEFANQEISEFAVASALDAKDNLIVCTQESIFVFDKEFNLCGQLSNIGYAASIAMVNDKPYVSFYDINEGKYLVKPLDVESNSLGKEIFGNKSEVYVFGGKDNNVLLMTPSALKSANAATGEVKDLFELSDVYVNANDVIGITEADDDRYTIVCENWDKDDNIYFDIVSVRKALDEEKASKEEVVIGLLIADDELNTRIIDFNRANPDVKIKTKIYYDDAENRDDAVSKMQNDMISGNVCDVFEMSMLDYGMLADKGALVDITKLLENDESFNLNDYLTNIFDAFKLDGKLYALPTSVYFTTIGANTKYAGDSDSWTISDILALRKEYADKSFVAMGTKESTLYYNLIFASKDYFDKKNGTCSFDSQEFIDLLEYCNSFPSSDDLPDEIDQNPFAGLKEEDNIMVYASLSSVYEYQVCNLFMNGNCKMKGFPSSSGASATISAGNCFSIANSSSHKDTAIRFIEYMLSEECQDSVIGRFPVRKSSLEKMLAEAATKETYVDETGALKEKPKMTYGTTEGLYEIYAASEEEIAEVRRVIESAKEPYYYDDKLYEIAYEEAASFFEGAKTAKEAAELIQNRMKIYLAEAK